MLKQSLRALALALPLPAHPLTIWEANNLVEQVVNQPTFNDADLGPINCFIREKIHNTNEINNLEIILKNTEQTLQAQQKRCPSDNCLNALTAVNGLLCGTTAVFGLCMGSAGVINAFGRTFLLWDDYVDQVNFLSQHDYNKDQEVIKEFGANIALTNSIIVEGRAQELKIIKAGAVAAVIGAAAFALGYTIEQKIKSVLNKRKQTELKLQAIRGLIEYLRYEQGKATAY